MASIEIDFVVKKAGEVVDRQVGHVARQMKGRAKTGPWLRVRHQCRDYRVEGPDGNGDLFIVLDNPIPRRPADPNAYGAAKASGRRY